MVRLFGLCITTDEGLRTEARNIVRHELSRIRQQEESISCERKRMQGLNEEVNSLQVKNSKLEKLLTDSLRRKFHTQKVVQLCKDINRISNMLLKEVTDDHGKI